MSANTKKPKALAVEFENIPEELRKIPRWVFWKYMPDQKEPNRDTWKKLPLNIKGKAANITNPDNWSTYDDIVEKYQPRQYDGVGLVLGPEVQGIDLDDCRDPNTRALSELATEVLERTDGYAEVSPSGTGIKIFSKTNLQSSTTNKIYGVELYKNNRYFTVTGNRIQGHEKLPETIQDLSWLVEKITQKGAIRDSNHIIKNDEFASFKNPISDWDLERIENEILLHLDPDCGYDEWLRVGQILHHQFNGDPEACDLWDQWSAESNKWVEGQCEEKWKTFKLAGNQSRGLLTLATLLQKTKSQRNSVAQKKRKAQLETYLQKINTCFDIQNIENDIAKEITSSNDLSDTEIEILGGAMQMRMKALGVQFPIAKIRAWLRPKPSAQTVFTHVSPDGHPLCTLENLRILLTQLGYVVRYNAIKKLIEIIIPDATFTRDNRDNAALARVLSECEKVRMPTKHVHQFLVTLADENLYNPVATWILSKPWDRRSRLKEFLATVQATGNQTLKDTLLRKWLIQAVAAAFAPDGLAAQGILTFVGPQNIGKTTWFQRLAPPELDVILTGHTLETRSKDSVFVALSFWIVELGEVDATIRKSDVAAFKSFITQPFDKIRRPYAATESNFGRRTVFGATVNDTYFLSDPTGNRRFWTIEVESFVLDHGIDIQQLWAEVYALWCNQEPFNLEPKDISALNEYNQDFSIIDPIEDRLTAKLHWNSANNWDWKTVTEALLRVGVLNPTRQQVLTASRILMKLNGGRRRKSNGRILFAIPEEIEEFLL